MTKYKCKGWGTCHQYLTDIGILTITSDANGDFAGYILQYAGNTYTGNDRDELVSLFDTLTEDLNIRSDNSRDIILVYVKNLSLVKAYLPYEKNKCTNNYIISGNIEFRSWENFTKMDAEAVMQDWSKIFERDKYPYLTPAQMPRKQLQYLLKNEPDNVYPPLIQLPLISKGVHGGICYARDQQLHTDMYGFDLVSAYIYSIAFKKHACEAPKFINTDLWDAYINAEDYGTIGRYKINYTCVFSAISCFKDVNGNSIKTGTHTVDIVLSNIDLRTLLSIPAVTINSVECITLFGFKLDYLPKTIRDYCIDLFMQKQSAVKDSAEYKRIKVILNSGLFGNFLYSMNKILESDDRNKAYKLENKSLCPQWGIFTMAYVKQIIFGIGIKAVEWVYSDTDSVYCKNDTFNTKLFNEYNNDVLARNIELCEVFGYPTEAAKLGTFDAPELITRLIANKRKQYWYETTTGSVVVKAAGCDKKQFDNIDPETIFTGNWIPPVGERHYVTWTEGKYFDLAK